MTAVRKILIVDDDQSTLHLLQFSFQAAGGYSVSTAQDGREALDIAIQNPPDLILTDVLMPKMDGYELCRELKQHSITHSIPVIMLTARGDSESTVEGFQAGADDYISKPFDPKEVMVRVERALRWIERKVGHAPKISGSLQKTPLFDLISFCEEHRISGIVHLARWLEEGKQSTKIQGKIHLHLGEIMAIQFKDIDDVTEALDELLEWQDGTFTIEQEELHLPALPGQEAEDAEPEEDSISEQIPAPSLPRAQEPEPQQQLNAEERQSPGWSSRDQEAVHRVLDELKIQSGDLDYADVADSAGNIVHAVGTLATSKSQGIRKALMNVVNLSERLSEEWELGTLDETMILSENGLVLLYQIDEFGTMSVMAPKESQGMMRWNCNDALEKILKIIS